MSTAPAARKVILTVWVFASSSSPGKSYQTLLYTDGSTSCECPGWTYKKKSTADGQRTCKHTRFVDMGTADVHAASRKDYQRGKDPSPRATGRKFDFAE